MAKGITVPVVQSGLEASIEAAAKKAGPLSLSATVDPSSFKRLAQPLGRVSGLATEFEKSIAASNARVIAFGASVGIINGVQNAFASLVKTTIEVEKSLANIAVISGKTTDQLQPFSRALFEIANNTAQSFATASEAALEFSRQGLSLEETLKRTQDALTLTRFTSLSAAEAVDVLTAAANSFGETGITTSEILNKLVAVDTKFAVSAEDLAKGLSRAGSIAQEVGVNFDELNAIVTIAQERTARGGAVIGNAFKTIFTRIRSDETIKALQSIGIYSFDAEGRLKPVVSLLEELAGKINTLGETKRIEVLEAIASKYNINVLTALVDDLGSTASKFREARDVSAGAQNEAYQRQIELNQTLDAIITRVTNSAAQLADTLGKIGVTDSLKSLLTFFENVLTGINDVIDSEGIGGTIAKGLISGISGVFFKIGIPLLLAIFVKLTKDIAQFGAESLKTILGINKEVRERQALEQAVVNTLIKDQQVMASILSLSGDRRKQEEYLLGVYNRQLAALQQVQSIASTVAPALQAAGLSATSGTVKKRAAEGYLPAQEAADVRRGVGGADKNAKVVKIPNFSFGGGKKGTMYANSSEYVVPNYNGGDGTAIFNKDMVRKYGMPENAKKINAASGYVPNFADGKYIYDSDRLPADKNALLKKILASKVKKNLILGPAGTGKTTFAAAGGTFITKPEDVDKAVEIDILSGAARTKDGGISANLESIISAVNLSGGKISYLYAGNMDIIARRSGREEKGAGEGDLRSEKQIAGTKYAPLNQFDFIEKVKTKARNFGIVKNAATGYIPNFAQKIQAETSETQAKQSDSITIADARGRSAMLVPDKKNERIMEAYLDKPLSFGFQTKDKGKKLGVDYVKYHTYGLNQEAFKAEGLKKSGDLTNIEADVQAFGLDIAKKYSYEYAGEYSKSLGGPATGIQISDADVRKAFLASKGAVSGFSSLGGGIFETAIRTGVQGEINKDLLKAQQAELGSGKLDFKVTDIIKRLFGVNRGETDADSKIEGNPKSTGRAFADQIAANNLYSSTSKVAIQNAAAGYIPNYINNQPKNIKAIREGNKFERYLNLQLFGQEEDAGSAVLDFPKKTGFGKDPEIRKKLGINPASQYGDAKRTRSKKSEKSLLDKYLRTEEGKQEFLKAQPLGKLINLNPAGLSMLFLNEGQDSKSFAKVETTEAILSEKTKELIKQKFPNTRASKIITMSYIADKINKDAVFDKKASMGYIPNYAEKLSEMYDWDGTIIPKILGKPEEYIQSIQKLEKKDLLPVGKELAASKEKFDIATARPIAFKDPIKNAAQNLGLNVEKVFPLGSMFENRRAQGKRGPRKLYAPERKALFAERTGRSIVDDEEENLMALGSRGINANLRNRASFGFIPNFASQNAIDAMRRIISDPAAPQGEKDAASLKLSQLAKASSSKNPKTTTQKTAKTKLPITQEDKDYLNQNKEKIVPGMGRSFGMLFNLDALEMGDLGYVKRLDPIVAKKLSEIAQKQGGRDSIRSLVDFGSAARGYIPNFAENEPLKEAISREMGAGVPAARVRVTQDGRLKNPKNPNGLAVINTRDEPNGKIPNDFRERGMRAAMASRGFVPNFADLSIRQIKQILGKSPNPISAERYTGGEDFDYGVQTQKQGGQKQEANDDAKKIDIGKFLVLQTAIVGATSALQTFTEQNSTAANAIEGVNAGLSGLATFASLATSVNLPLRILLGSFTALASAAPLISRIFEAQKTPADRAAEALSKLTKEAERTGQKLTPEALLAALQQGEQQGRAKEESVKVSELVAKQLQTLKISASEKDILSISGLISATEKVQRDQTGKITALAPNALDFLQPEKGFTQKQVFGVPTPATAGPIEKNVIDQNKLQEEILNQLNNEIENNKKRLTTRTQAEGATALELALIKRDNELILAKQKATESIFRRQLKINEAYNNQLLQIDGLNAALDREKVLLTESAFITQKANAERQKSQADYTKAVDEAALSLAKNLGAGGESILGGGVNVQEFLGKLAADPDRIKKLVGDYAKALEDSADGVTPPATLDNIWSGLIEGLEGVPENLKQLQPATKKQFFAFISSAGETVRLAGETKKTADSSTAQRESNEKLTTESENLRRSILSYTAILDGVSVSLDDGRDPIDGAAKYAQMLGSEQQKLTEYVIKQKVSSKISLDTAKQKAETELSLALDSEELSKKIRALNLIETDAATAASKLRKETEDKIYQSKIDVENIKLKIKTDTDLVDAETSVLQAYIENYNGILKENDIRSSITNALAKIRKSEIDKKKELEVQIATIRENYIAEENDTKRKIKLGNARLQAITQEDYNRKASLDLIKATQDLAEARRVAVADLQGENLTQAITNQVTSAGTANLQEIRRTIVEGGALRSAGVQSSFEQQARSAVVERRMAGRTEVDLRESTNILSGRDNSIQENLQIQRGVLLDQAETFQQIIGNQTPKLFADGMAEAMQAALNQADDLGGALRNVALTFLKNLQSAFLQSASRQIVASILPTGKAQGGYIKGYASGGLVTGGSGYKDDVPAMLSEGEYVIRKSSVNKYGASNLQKLNSGEAPKFADGGIFLPGVRGQGQISGYKDLTAFAKQTTTSGATDVLAGGATTAFANLEDQSSRLSAYALMREDDTINQEIRSAQEQAMNIIAEREAYRTAERKAFQKQLVSTVASAALSYGVNAGVGKLGSLFAKTPSIPNIASNEQLTNQIAPYNELTGTIGNLALPTPKGVASGLNTVSGPNLGSLLSMSRPKTNASFLQGVSAFQFTRPPGRAYGGAVKRYNTGGPTDDIPALLMGGEYVMNRQATKKYGRQFFDSINQGRAPRFADGGNVSTAEPSFAEKAASSSDSKATGATNVSININVTSGTSDTQTQGDTKQGGVDYKKMSEQIKQVVIQTINEEKRLGGSLRSR